MSHKKVYTQIVFFHDNEANDVLKMIENCDYEMAIEYLKQWDNGDGGEELESNPKGTGDEEYQKGDYLMSFNRGLEYVGLCKIEYVPQNENETHRLFKN